MESMHTRFETRARLPAPPERVWALLEDMTTWRRWTDVFDVAPGAPRPTWREGHRLRVGPTLMGVRLWATVEICEAIAPARLTWRGHLMGIPGQHGFVFEPGGEGSCLMTHWEACGGVGGKLAAWSGAWGLLRARFEQFNQDLISRLEADG